jgi:peroxiredoxin Q/BCP
MPDMPAVGQLAPDFTLPNQDGTPVTLAEFRGKFVVLYFYPKDNTPGCTKEACSLRDNQPALVDANAVVLGVSTDSSASHRKFIDKFALPFHLLADTNASVSTGYGVYGEKTRCGKTTIGMLRTTFIIAPDGLIRKVITKVDVDGHGAEVLAAIRE